MHVRHPGTIPGLAAAAGLRPLLVPGLIRRPRTRGPTLILVNPGTELPMGSMRGKCRTTMVHV